MQAATTSLRLVRSPARSASATSRSRRALIGRGRLSPTERSGQEGSGVSGGICVSSSAIDYKMVSGTEAVVGIRDEGPISEYLAAKAVREAEQGWLRRAVTEVFPATPKGSGPRTD